MVHLAGMFAQLQGCFSMASLPIVLFSAAHAQPMHRQVQQLLLLRHLLGVTSL